MKSYLTKSRIIGIGLFVFLLAVVACEDEPKTKITPAAQGISHEFADTLSFLNKDGSINTTLRYASATTDQERSQGLMDVHSMPRDAGMVFFFDEEEEQSFWMANTPLSLDIIYVNADSVIVSIYQNAKAYTDKSMPSGAPAQYVIETNAGFTIDFDIKEGDKVRF